MIFPPREALNIPLTPFSSSSLNVRLADRDNHLVRKLFTNASGSFIVTIAGQHGAAYSPWLSAADPLTVPFVSPQWIAVTSGNDILLTDQSAMEVRRIIHNEAGICIYLLRSAYIICNCLLISLLISVTICWDPSSPGCSYQYVLSTRMPDDHRSSACRLQQGPSRSLHLGAQTWVSMMGSRPTLKMTDRWALRKCDSRAEGRVPASHHVKDLGPLLSPQPRSSLTFSVQGGQPGQCLHRRRV